MEPRNVRRVPLSRDQTAQWDNPWLEPAKKRTGQISALLARHSSRITFWAGIAGLCGGVLWIILLAYLQLLTGDIFYRTDLITITAEKLLVAPMLLFSVSLFGIYVQQIRVSSWLGNLSIALSFLGLCLAIRQNIYDYWIAYGWDDMLVNRTFGHPYPIMEWYTSVIWGLLIFAAGFLLFAIASLKNRLPSRASILALAASTPFMYFVLLGPLPLIRSLGNQNIVDLIVFQNGGLAGLLALLGIAWVWVGVALLRSISRPTAQVEARQG